MYVSREQLEQTYRTLSTSELLARLRSGSLMPEARLVAQAELALRTQTGESVEVSAPPPAPPRAPASHSGTRPLWTYALWAGFGVYLGFLGACLIATMADPPSNLDKAGAYSGMIGLIASEAAGFPVSTVATVIFGGLFMTKTGSSTNFSYVFIYVSWACAVGNAIGLAWFIRRMIKRRT